MGPTGTGKTFLTCGLIASLSTEKFINNIVNFSARTNVNYTQDVIMSKLDRRRKGVYGPAMGKKCIIFIDDLNLPQKDVSGTIPPVELLRCPSFICFYFATMVSVDLVYRHNICLKRHVRSHVQGLLNVLAKF